MLSLNCRRTDKSGEQGRGNREGDAVEESPSHRGIGGDQIDSFTVPPEFRRCLCRQGLGIDQQPFQQGYVAGWQSVRGKDDQPVLIPPSPVLVGLAMYMVGFSRGARDAGAMMG
jgi:hypothetical protein